MKTIIRENKVAPVGKYQHYFCEYCSKILNPDEIKALRCNRCKEYLTGDATTGMPRITHIIKDANGKLKIVKDTNKG